MFFDDPEAAFVNIRRAARSDAKLAFVACEAPAENPFMTTAARAPSRCCRICRGPRLVHRVSLRSRTEAECGES